MVIKEKDVSLTTTGKELIDALLDTRQRELELMEDLSSEQLSGPRIRNVEPPLWELGHVGWFQDRWVLQHIDKQKPVSKRANSLYDSFNIPNSERFELYFPDIEETKEYIQDVLDRIIQRLEGREPTEEEIYFYRLSTNHEDMHTETLHHIRQTCGYSAPSLSLEKESDAALTIDPDYESHDVEIPEGTYQLGGTKGTHFVFDNEKWAHPVQINPFEISSTPVTFGQYMKFVDEGGYGDRSLWSDEGLAWLEKSQQTQPVFWKKDGENWVWRWFDKWLPTNSHHPMIHVNWYEANAYSAWAGRRLPSEAEWELAASSEPSSNGNSFTETKRMYPWGDHQPTNGLANLDSRAMGLVDVRAYSAGDSAFGVRQMIGNVWEWTADTFEAFPGYVIDPYETYSEPSFGQQKVLRGGCWATRSRVIRNTFRNFYTPDRNNIFAGFRTIKK